MHARPFWISCGAVVLTLGVSLACSSGRTETVDTWDVSALVNPPASQPAALSSSEVVTDSGAEAGAGGESD